MCSKVKVNAVWWAQQLHVVVAAAALVVAVHGRIFLIISRPHSFLVTWPLTWLWLHLDFTR
jgi:hypothetical protein